MEQVFHDFLTLRFDAILALNKRCGQLENQFSDEFFAETIELAKTVLGLSNLEIGRAAGKYSRTVVGWVTRELSATKEDRFKVLSFFAERTGKPLAVPPSSGTFLLEGAPATLESGTEDTQGSLDTDEPATGSGGR